MKDILLIVLYVRGLESFVLFVYFISVYQRNTTFVLHMFIDIQMSKELMQMDTNKIYMKY